MSELVAGRETERPRNRPTELTVAPLLLLNVLHDGPTDGPGRRRERKRKKENERKKERKKDRRDGV